MTITEEHLHADLIPCRRILPNQVYPEGRICETESCRTVLSIYNGTHWCAIHERAEMMSRPFKASDFLRG